MNAGTMPGILASIGGIWALRWRVTMLSRSACDTGRIALHALSVPGGALCSWELMAQAPGGVRQDSGLLAGAARILHRHQRQCEQQSQIVMCAMLYTVCTGQQK